MSVMCAANRVGRAMLTACAGIVVATVPLAVIGLTVYGAAMLLGWDVGSWRDPEIDRRLLGALLLFAGTLVGGVILVLFTEEAA